MSKTKKCEGCNSTHTTTKNGKIICANCGNELSAAQSKEKEQSKLDFMLSNISKHYDYYSL